MTAVDEILTRNAAYAEGHLARPVMAELGLIVVTCFDPRVDPAHVLGLKPGDAFVIRSVGGRITPAVLQNLSLLTGVLTGVLTMNAGDASMGEMEIVVMHHTKCGITRLADPPHRQALAEALGTTAADLDEGSLRDPFEAVRLDLATLANSDVVPGEMSATGLVFDIDTGRAELVERRRPLRVRFVPDGFVPPRGLVSDRFVLEPLGPEHNESDLAAWSSSIEHIRATPGFEGRKWPERVYSLEENLADLVQHRVDFETGTGFAYTVLAPGSRQVVGCVYLYPPRRPGYDVDVRSWVRQEDAPLDKPLAEAINAWLASEWPWRAPDVAPR